MARADTRTLLTIDRFARILGANPVHLNGGAGEDIYPNIGYCGSVYPQYTWQVPDNLVSREEIAQAIFSAEQDIKRILGYSPAPVWECAEPYAYEGGRMYYAPPFKTQWGKFIAGGRRKTDFVGTYTVVYSDLDGDGYNETATLTVADAQYCAGDITVPLRELKVYFKGKGAHPTWEIRYPKSVVRTDGFIVVTMDSWLFFDPELTHAPPTPLGFQPVSIMRPESYVTEVEVWREYNDPASVSVESYAFDGTTMDVSNGTLVSYNHGLGFVFPVMDGGYCATGRGAQHLKTWYLAGDTDCAYDADLSSDPLSEYWAQTITWMAASRLEKPMCSCTNVQTIVSELHRSIVANPREGGDALVDFTLVSNPFGTRVGEIRAWQRTMNMQNEQIMMAGAL